MKLKITPNANNCIVKLIPNDEKIGPFIIPDSVKEKSTLALVLVPPRYSYHHNGDLKDPQIKAGMKVRIPVGKCGTTVPEAPKGEEWLCIPEDAIYYTIEEENENG